ncbi:1-(5-phosphoribosyl)-5-[(5-phosphoribosylamino)methylideneamino]imidazole-4-carboxamide isomerase [Selenomonas sp. WCA-380-WT-3B 3/]|uniref:1-(5-phosphoribosyl)-5-[(5-phosphoribosylamino)methylideneamino] imidazole-4-carboxamide isomerase n=1 Tax=Selenomonas montiformis TaxID=2652285 RepID=A0A6I2UQ43_9FIRM|nr:1-(5-phosphoribosyl)-5-[(5-phosphoribosylamino)methylideneamino]imidazole-4-carboxamide isomerase [Selenomonas montiformis]MSV24303.1 1-(5-phosphoribosyl)-5-[(5-phosphoribosylamino)methylideneamino]imidazole-4-carboxamide isomerase [Selenomonas montiformis]
MLIFPAIDIRGGKCVRLLKGDFNQETVFSDRPEEMARQWEKQGAEYLHLVDLDGARAGHPENLETVKRILDSVSIPVELGGGIRTMENIDTVLSLGVQRVILGSVAVKDPELVRQACKKYQERIVVGIDAKDGIVAVDGWGVSGNVDVTTLAKEMKKAGVKTIIYTDISRDGTLKGINVKATAELARESGVRIVASGGVKSTTDIEALKPYEKDGIEGVIVGKSIYMGTLDLQQAIEIAAKED